MAATLFSKMVVPAMNYPDQREKVTNAQSAS